MNDIPGKELRFVADAMLKKLAKYLRALGYDTLFDKSLSDQELREKTQQESRVLLTRDQELYEATPDQLSYYVEPLYPTAQLQAVADEFALLFNESRFMCRCLECNTLLMELEKEDLPHEIPPRVDMRHEVFYYCSSCDQVFWRGDHVARLRKKLSQILLQSPP